MTVTPLRNQVLVQLDTDAQTRTASGIVVQRLHQEPSMYATVQAVGPEVRETRAGERVVVSRLQGIQVGDAVLLPESAVLAHVVITATLSEVDAAIRCTTDETRSASHDD